VDSKPTLFNRPLAKRLAICSAISVIAAILALLAGVVWPFDTAVQKANDGFYDVLYRLRPIDDQTNGEVVIVTADQGSLDAVDKTFQKGWPWPREFWGRIAAYVSKCGAKAVVFDMIFSETSDFQNSDGDDDTMAEKINGLKCPAVFGLVVTPSTQPSDLGSWQNFALQKVDRKIFGAANTSKDAMVRDYAPTVLGQPSLAVAGITAAGESPKLPIDQKFLIHFYGPNQTSTGQRTYRFLAAANVLAAALRDDPETRATQTGPDTTGITPDMFRGKIVLIGATAAGANDIKSSPLSNEYPGVEIHATAITNLLKGDAVRPVPTFWQILAPLLAAAIVCIGVIFPRAAMLKMLGPILSIAAILGSVAYLFTRPAIHWLPPTPALIAISISTIAAFAWTYFAEDRQRKFMLKALSKVVSPAVAEQLSREPRRLSLGTVRTEITLLFTDLANFTNLSEAMDVQKLGDLLNTYLGAMSDEVLQNQGTLDKYIGDAIMCFWNAPLPQPSHAVQACRAALAIARKEDEIRAELQALGAASIFTRIGINTTSAAVGFVGSSHLFNYTALGDGVNLASRLEGANKLYGTRILLAQSTADLVKDQFILRRVDVLKVKGKTQPMAVYDLLADRADLAASAALAGHPPGNVAPEEHHPRGGTRLGAPGESLETLVREYDKAFSAYQSQKWDEAERLLLEILNRFVEDAPSKELLRRVASLRAHPPVKDWDGVYEAKDK
jgi:adenylate cyclase